MVWIGKKSDVERFLVFGFEGTYKEALAIRIVKGYN